MCRFYIGERAANYIEVKKYVARKLHQGKDSCRTEATTGRIIFPGRNSVKTRGLNLQDPF
jgi:hypothetical protein